MNENEIFNAAVKLSLNEQARFLDLACKGNPELRGQVESLLKAHFDSATFLRESDDKPQDRRLMETIAQSGTAEHPGTLIAGRYKLLEAIGEGGMGSVWLAEQREPVRRKVAIKLIKAGMDSKSVLARFDAERQALAVMDHPNIAKVFDGGMTEQGRPYFVMEYVKGVPLTEYCDQARLSLKERLSLFMSVCQAVQHAHQKGIIHRDLKPSNILICLYDGKPVPKVIDFGLAKAMHQSLTEQSLHTAIGMMVGTPLYMSPEQAEHNNLDVDTRTDIYSLGVILYELLTGSTPLERQQMKEAAFNEILRLIKEVEPPKPSTRLSSSQNLPSIAAQRSIEPNQLKKSLLGDLDWIVMKALDKERSRRYETANGLARDIDRFLNDEAVEACPPSTAYRLKKLLRRNKRTVAAVGAITATLLFATGVSVWFAVSEAEQRKVAEVNQRIAEEERTKAEIAVQRESEQRSRAENARDRTRDVLDAMTSSATRDSLSTQREISEDQKKFLTEVLTYYQEFAGERAEDEQSRKRTARAAFRVARIEQQLGRMEQAITAFQLARDGYRTLATDYPTVPEYRQELAGCHLNLGNLLADLKKTVEATTQYGEALITQELMALDFPEVHRYRHDLASSRNNLGRLLADLGQQAEAEEQYRKALTIQLKLVADFPAEPGYRQNLANIRNNLGSLLDDLENRTEAEDQYRKALAIQLKLAADFPQVHEYRLELAGSHLNLGILLGEMEEREEAEKQFRMALDIQVKLAAEFPTVPAYRHELALTYTNLGVLLDELGKLAEAEGQYRNALAVQEKLVTDFLTVPAYRKGLALSHNNLGALLADLGKQAEAEEQYRRALAVREKLASDSPADDDHQFDLALSYWNYGKLFRDRERSSESLGWFDKAIATFAKLHLAQPGDATVIQLLSQVHKERAEAYEAIAKPAEADMDWDRAIELSSPAEQLEIRASRATSRLQAGRNAEAVSEVDELTRTAGWNADQSYNFACVYAVASSRIADKKQEYADRAMQLLVRAVESGFQDHAHLAKDADLDPIRAREDFKLLLKSLNEKHPTTDKAKQP